jgi:AcrR family transcriptional regulator
VSSRKWSSRPKWPGISEQRTNRGYPLPKLGVTLPNIKLVEDFTPPRAYRMTARAVNAEATGERILDAAVEVFWERPSVHIALEEVAQRADVSVQTVIRRFGGKGTLFAAAVGRETAAIRSQRDQAPADNPVEAVRVLVDHYEAYGDRVLKVLAEQDHVPAFRQIADGGRKVHHQWCTRVFADALATRVGVDRRRCRAQLIAICDVYVWKLLRRDAGLSRKQTELALIELLIPLVGGGA